MEKNNEILLLKEKIEQLEKIKLALIERVEKSVSSSDGAFNLFQKNALLQSEIDKKDSQLSDTQERVLLQNTFINEMLLISETDKNGIILSANEKFCARSGYSASELVGKNHKIVNSGNHSPEFWKQFWTTLKSGKAFRGEICNRDKKGELYWVDTVIYPKIDKSGAITGYISVRLDITENKKLQMKNQHTEKLAAIGELAAGVGHEINNPLAISVGNLSLLKSTLLKCKIDPSLYQRHLEKIEYAHSRIKTIVNGLRVFSRSDSESVEEISIESSISQILDLLKAIYKAEGVEVTVHNNSEFVFYALANEGKFQQIIINLLSNAKDAVENRVHKKIEIRLAENGSNEIILSVKDNGVGIPENLIPKITAPFFTTKGVGKGTGIGLGLVSNYINLFKGRLEIESEVDIGSTFHVILPISKKELREKRCA